MSTQPARGMRDFLPEDVRRRQYVIGVIADVYQRYGFEPLETPAVENIETLLGKYGEEGDKLIFKILKRGEGAQSGEADLALRYDLTVPLARVVAEHRATLPKFFKRYQVQPVWRADRPQKGRFREFYQCDVDAIGSKSMIVEAELLTAASDILRLLKFEHFTIRLSHRRLLKALMEVNGVPSDLEGTAIAAVDKLDKIGSEGVARELTERGVPRDAASNLLGFFTLNVQPYSQVGDAIGRNGALLGLIESDFGNHPEGAIAVRELSEILSLLKPVSTKVRVVLDPSLARGLSYYTGSIFEIAVSDLAGSLGGGGRYDNLIGMFLGQDVPACGISLGLERILVVMAERGMFPDGLASTPADVLVTLWNAERASDSLDLAATLRASGLRVEVYPEADKLGKQFKYAATRNIPFVIVAGEEEAARGEVAVKTLESGEQSTVPRGNVVAYLESLRPV